MAEGERRGEGKQRALLEQYKWEICVKCPMSMRCLQGNLVPGYWCDACVGWWFPEINAVIRCDEFVNTKAVLEDYRKRYDKNEAVRQAPMDGGSMLSFAHMNHRVHCFIELRELRHSCKCTTLANCPHCSPADEDEAATNRPRLVVGVLYEDA